MSASPARARRCSSRRSEIERATAATATFLFTDIEGSTGLVQSLGDRYPALLEDHRRLISEAVEDNGGRIFGSEGDALFIVFQSASAAISAAATAQRALAAHDWPDNTGVRVRMGVHTGEAALVGGDYVGLALHQVARITAAGHGGQVLVSEATRRVVSKLPQELELRDLGERRLKDLASPERLYQLVGAGLAESFPPLLTLDTKPNNLPLQLTSFVGRDELAAARAALAATRLLTLTGPGGTGKTRLALQLAADASDDFQDGVFFVALDAVRDPNLVPSVIASTLELAIAGSAVARIAGATQPLAALADYLRDKSVLLVLDNFEQVVDAASDVTLLLRECPHLKIIVTTRIVLRVYGEREFPVPPLAMPGPSVGDIKASEASAYEAVQLFTERAMAVQPSFVLTDDNAPIVADIVRRLDGLPLAIELAAARTRVLPVSAIRSRLDRHLALLVGGARDLPERQQTLRGAIDWSYDLLEPPDRRLFERFSVHSGGAYLAQADDVCGPSTELGEDVLDGLTSLAEKSLVRSGVNGNEEPRFAMLGTIRDYAYERLATGAEHEELRRRHANAYLELVEGLEPQLLGPNAGAAADRLEADHDNVRAALDWAVERNEGQYAMRFVIAVWRFWQTRGHLDEARKRTEAVLALPAVAEAPAELLSRAYGAAGGVAYWQGDESATHRYYARALEEAQRSGDKRLIAQSLYNFSFAPLDRPHPSTEGYAAGRQFAEESLALFRELGDTQGIADAQWVLSIAVVASQGDTDDAIAHTEEALQKYRQLNNAFGAAWASYMAGTLHLTAGRIERAARHFRDALEIFRESRDQSGILLLLASHALVAGRRGETTRALRLGGAAERLREQTGAGLADTPVEFLTFALPERPTDPEKLSTWDEGRRMSVDEAVEYALKESGTDD